MAVLDRFNGSGNLESWICRAEQYFTYLGFSEKDWLPLPYFYLEGEALTWFTWLHRNEQFFDWKHFTTKLRLRFPQRSVACLMVSLDDPSLVCFTTERSDANVLTDAMDYDLNDATSDEVQMFDECSHQNEARASTTQSTHISAGIVSEIAAPIQDKVFDAFTQSDEQSDATLLVPLVGHDHLVPGRIEPFPFSESLCVESVKLLSATALTSRMKSELESEQVGADQVFAKIPQQNADQQLIQFAPLIMDPSASLVSGDRFVFGQTLVVPVNFNLNDRHTLDIYDCCHMRACASRCYKSESTKGTFLFCSGVDEWFDTGQDFRADSGVLLSFASGYLKHIEGFIPLITTIDLDGEYVEIAESSPCLVDQSSVSLLPDGFWNVATHTSLPIRVVFSGCQALGGTHIYIVPNEQLERDMPTKYVDASVYSNPPIRIIELATFEDLYLAEVFMDPIIFYDQYLDNFVMETEGAILTSARHSVKVLLEDMNESSSVGFTDHHILNQFPSVQGANFLLVTIHATTLALCVWDPGINFVFLALTGSIENVEALVLWGYTGKLCSLADSNSKTRMWDPERPWVVNYYNLQSDLARYSYVDTNQNLLPCLLKIALFLLVTDSSGELNLAKDDIELLRHVDCFHTRVAITGTLVALGPPKFTFTGLMLQFCCAAFFNVVVLVGTRFFTAMWNINCAKEIKIVCTSDAHFMAFEIINYQLGVTLASVTSLFATELCRAIARGTMSTESSLLSSNRWKMSGIFSSILGGGYMSSVHQVALSENYDAHIYLKALPNNFLPSNLSLMLLKVIMILAGQSDMLKHSKIIILLKGITALAVGLERIVQEAQVKCDSLHAKILTCCLMICVDVGPKFVLATVATISCHVDKIVIAHICSSYVPQHLCLEIFSEECAATIVLDSNLEDKLLFEDGSIVVYQAESIRAYGLEEVNEAKSIGVIGLSKILESFIWDPGPFSKGLKGD